MLFVAFAMLSFSLRRSRAGWLAQLRTGAKFRLPNKVRQRLRRSQPKQASSVFQHERHYQR